ncbi:MAG: E3 binding domain-containing protein, partial [Phycisphaerae bacterium]
MTEFKLPDLGENVAGGDVVQVLVKEGDVIRPEQPVIEIETDKAVVEVPCPVGGRVAKVHVQPGQAIKVGAALVSIEEGGSTAAAPAVAESAPAKPQPASRPAAEHPEGDRDPSRDREGAVVAAQGSAGSDGRGSETAAGASVTASGRVASRAPRPVGPPPQPRLGEGEPIPAGPATRRLARELGVDLREVAAAFPGERLTESHVKNFVKQRLSAPVSTPPAGGPPTVTVPPLPDFAQWGPVERVAFTTLQRKTADHLSAAWHVAPHVTHFDEADVTALEGLRKRFQ